jgi:hypothetical protein
MMERKEGKKEKRHRITSDSTEGLSKTRTSKELEGNFPHKTKRGPTARQNSKAPEKGILSPHGLVVHDGRMGHQVDQGRDYYILRGQP